MFRTLLFTSSGGQIAL